MNSELLKIWNYKLLTIKGHPLTVEEIVAAAIVLIVGILLAYGVNVHIKKILTKSSQMKDHYVALICKIIRCMIFIFTFLIVLDIMHIPLASLAMIGGCLAVGIGFGIRNLINNLICGFILMGERPIKIGDVVEIEGNIGVVEKIGLRSTKVHTEDNIHIIFPNTKLMDEKLINWSYRNHEILSFVEVGISYKSDVETASELMLEALKSTKKILRKPEPFILFWNYAESTLIFHVYFAMQAHTKMQRWEMESKVRYGIFKTLSAKGISFAFPQRDVHLDVSKPLPIQIKNKSI